VTANIAQMRATDLLARLQRHYIKPGADLPGGVFVPEVGINGATQSRCDAIYVGFTSTSGRRLVGHELKVSRSDWQHELDQAGKADFWHDNTHQWYVVAPVGIVDPETLPAGWGLMVPSARTTTRMTVVVKAADRDVVPSWRAVRSIIARQDTLRAGAIHQARMKARDDAQAQIDKARRDLDASTVASVSPQAQRLANLIAKIDAAGRESGWLTVADEDIVAAALDSTKARRAARDLRYRIERAVHEARSLTNPFAHVGDQLAALVAGIEEAS
jgi:hypothetical protein